MGKRAEGRANSSVGAAPFCSVVGLLGIVLVAGCSRAMPPNDTRDLRCGSIPWPSVETLCARVERELELTRGGHGLIRGYLGYWCTEKTVTNTFCSGIPIVIPDVEAVLDFASSERQEELNLDTRLNACLVGLRDAAREAARPKKDRNPIYEIVCR